MEPDDPAGSAALGWLDPAMGASTGSGAEAAVGALCRAQAVGLIRLAYLMLGDARKLGDYEQILYTNDDGSVLVLTYQRPGAKAAIVHDGLSTPIPWSSYIGAAARGPRGTPATQFRRRVLLAG